LVIAGKPSREIAEMLHLSPRTVEHHIEAIFNKFGVRSRVELAVALLGQGPTLSPDGTAHPPKTNLPTERSSLVGREAEIADIARAAAAVGARVLIDEVYLELTFEDGAARTAFDPDGNIITTSSLTKAYGLSGLRCGWILAPADLALRMRRLNDLFGVAPPHIAERLSVVAFNRLPALRARARGMMAANLAAYRDLLADHPALDQTLYVPSTTVFPRLRSGDGDALYETLMRDHETSLTPGRFFGRPDHVRLALGGHPEVTRPGLERLAGVLDARVSQRVARAG